MPEAELARLKELIDMVKHDGALRDAAIHRIESELKEVTTILEGEPGAKAFGLVTRFSLLEHEMVETKQAVGTIRTDVAKIREWLERMFNEEKKVRATIVVAAMAALASVLSAFLSAYLSHH